MAAYFTKPPELLSIRMAAVEAQPHWRSAVASLAA